MGGGRSRSAAFPIGRVLGILREAAPRWNAPVVTFIGISTGDPFRVLIACLLSLRTKDETTGPAARRLFALADTPTDLARLSEEEIARAIYPVGFYRNKARGLRAVSREILERFAGHVPDEIDDLLTLPGVGRKTANLVRAQGFGKPAICVDTHVHRICNRWAYVATRTPGETETALRERLPRRHWAEINHLLVAFGQTICKPLSPLCTTACPVLRYCPRIGVGAHR